MDLETEFKAMLTPEQYRLIAEAFPFGSETRQENFYYSYPGNVIAPGHCTVRIREKNGRYRLQVKIHRGTKDGLTTAEEYESEIAGIPDTLCSDRLPVRLCDENTLLTLDGSLVTFRSVFSRENYELCLDRSEYAGITDYEVELEYRGSAPSDVIEKLNGLGIVFSGVCPGKYARFRAASDRR